MDLSKLKPNSDLPEPLKSCVENLFKKLIKENIVSASIKAPVLGSILKNKTPPPEKGFQFEKLPTELRFKIWEELVSEPRTVEIYATNTHFQGRESVTLTSNNPVPVALHINKESRQVALRHYQLSFRSNNDAIHKCKPTIYFNFDNDLAFLKSITISETKQMQTSVSTFYTTLHILPVSIQVDYLLLLQRV